MKRRNGAIDFWRFIFALNIAVSHTINLIMSNSKVFIINGNLGVEFFFMVSGFLMAKSIMKTDFYNKNTIGTETSHFIIKKFKSLMPNTIVSLITALFVVHIINPVSLSQTISDIFNSMWSFLLINMNGMYEDNPNPPTWYLSSMLLVMFVLFPLIKKYRERFFTIIAPIICLFCFGYIFQLNDGIFKVYTWQKIAMFGTIRALAEISLGTILFYLCNLLKEAELNTSKKILLSIFELGGYIATLIWSVSKSQPNSSFVITFFIALSVLISFSEKSATTNIFNNKLSYFLGKFSFSLYLSHYYWGDNINSIYPNHSLIETTLVSLAISFLNAFVLMIICDKLKSIKLNKSKRIQKLFLKKELEN